MTGVKYYRILNKLSREKLAEMTGISIPTLKKMEIATNPSRICTSNYRKVSLALQVSVRELIRYDFPDPEDGGPVRAPRKSKVDNKNNCISVFRLKLGMTYQRLADYMKLSSRQRAHQICCDEEPLTKYVEMLAHCQNMNVADFIKEYSA